MLQYTFDWMVMGKSNIYRAKTAKQALKIIKRFKQKAKFSDCLFVSIGKANEPSYSAKCAASTSRILKPLNGTQRKHKASFIFL